MTITGTTYTPYLGSLPTASAVRRAPLEETGQTFSELTAEADTVHLSPQASGLSEGTASATSAPDDLTYYEDPRTVAVIERDEQEAKTNPNIMVYDEVLTPSDKQLLGALQGTGHWQSNGPANMLVDEIAGARFSGTLTGNVTPAFIQNIMSGESVGGALQSEPDSLVPLSLLSAALTYLQKNVTSSAEVQTAGTTLRNM